MTAPHLRHGGRMCLRKQAPERPHPGIWSGVGGHVEHYEFTDLRVRLGVRSANKPEDTTATLVA